MDLTKKQREQLSALFYSPRGYWKGESAVDQLHRQTGIDKPSVRRWLKRQALWQLYLPPPPRVPRPTTANQEWLTPNAMHQMDVLYLPWDKFKRKTYKYALTVVDVASRYKEAEPLTSKIASQVADAIKKIYGRSPLTWPAVARVDAGTEFKGEFKQLFRAKNVELIEGVPGVHRSQGIVERFNRTLAERLFGHQYAQEMLNPKRETSNGSSDYPEWLKPSTKKRPG